MNVKEYIASGKLEAYAMGDLSSAERAEVENALASHPELKRALLAIEEAQEQLLMSSAIAPPQRVREKLLSSVGPDPRVVPMDRGASKVWQLSAAAAITIALVSSYLAFDYRTRWKNAESELLAFVDQNQRIAEDVRQVSDRLKRLERDLHIVENPQFRRVVMQGTPSAEGAVASVYWNQTSHEVYLSIGELKALTREHQYQLWAIIDGKPVDAGVFDSDGPGLIRMKDIGRLPTMFAVTIEKRGGSSSPTLETMQVSGSI